MSTTDPDARDRTAVRRVLWAVTIALGAIGLLAAPVLTSIPALRELSWFGYLLWPDLAVLAVAGYLGQRLPGRRGGLAVTGFVLAGAGGVLLFLGVDAEQSIFRSPWLAYVFLGLAIVAYALAVIVTIDSLVRDFDRKETLTHGVAVTGVITSDVPSGIRQLHERHRLTVKFTDAAGTDRWTHATRIGGDYAVGRPIAVRYDPEHPGRNRAVLVEG